MKVYEVEPNVDTPALLPGAQFGDAYSVAVDDAALTARRRPRECLDADRDGSTPC